MSTQPRDLDGDKALQRALDLVRRSRQRIEQLEAQRREPIAILGAACRFPGCEGIDGYWQLLVDGRVVVGDYPADRFGEAGRSAFSKGAYLADVDSFDAGLFGISEREALAMDPQHRLLLEVSYEALEDAGIPVDSLRGSDTGVFVGIMSHDYSQAGVASKAPIDGFTAVGNGGGIAAGRIAHTFGLEGPVVSMDTNCSSSLVALHMACQSLRLGECQLAVVAGVNLILSPAMTTAMSRAGALSADGRCRPFEAGATGYGRGEGCGVVVLKTASAAARDGDQVLALIRGSAVNHGGRSTAMPVPRSSAQHKVIAAALKQAAVDPAAVSYVEAHGTGTLLGDPVEVEALAQVYGTARPDGQPLLLGSSKANIGHLESAAGMAGVVKAVEILRRGLVPAQPPFEAANPHVPWGRARAAVVRESRDLPSTPSDRYVGVSAFGFCGTNAHAVLQGAPETRTDGVPTVAIDGYVLPISARHPEAARALRQSFRERLAPLVAHPAAFWSLCAEAGIGRSHHEHRLAAAGASPEELLRDLDSSTDPTAIRECKALLHLPSGGPSQGHGFDALYEHVETFRAAFDEAAAKLLAAGTAGEIQPGPLRAADPGSRRARTFCIDVAMGALLRSWRVTPALVCCAPDRRPSAVAIATPGALARAAEALARELRTGTASDLANDLLAGTGGRVRLVEALPPSVRGETSCPLALTWAGAGDDGCDDLVSVGAGGDIRLRSRALAALYLAGAGIRWSELYPRVLPRRPRALPGYPFRRTRIGRLTTSLDVSSSPPAAEPPAAESALDVLLETLRSLGDGTQPPLTGSSRIDELALDSLSSMELQSALSRRLGRELPREALESSATLGELAELLSQGSPPVAQGNLIRLKPGEAGSTGVFFHPVGGSCLPYVAMAQRLPSGIPLAAVEAMRDGSGSRHSIPSMARSYLSLLEREGLAAPGFLGGWSMGGFIAIEMANQILARTGRATPVFLVDSVWQTLPGGDAIERQAYSLLLFGLDIGLGPVELMREAELRGPLSAALDQLHALLKRSRSGRLDLGRDTFTSLYHLFASNLVALDEYELPSYPGPTTLVIARRGFGPSSGNFSKVDWTGRIPRLRVFEIDTDHFQIMRAPALESVCEQLFSFVSSLPSLEGGASRSTVE